MDRLPAKFKSQLDGPPERRRAKRQRPHVRVSWRVLGDRDGRFNPAELKDIGRGGLALIVDRACKHGTVVVVQVQGVEDEPLLLRVEWTKQEAADKWLVGCSFTSALTDEEIQALVQVAQKVAAQPVRAEARPKPVDDPFVVGSARERRSAPRRAGLTVPVLISRAEGGSRIEGFVADRSMTGLGILTRLQFARGTRLTIRPRNADAKTPALKVQVRSCRQKADQWLLGCQFLHSPPANMLLLFG